MRMCSVKNLKPGDVLGTSIFLPNNRLLLGAGYRVTNQIKTKLVERGYSHVYIMEEGTEDVIPEDVISDEIRAEAKLKLEDKVEKIKKSIQLQEMSYVKVIKNLCYRNFFRHHHRNHSWYCKALQRTCYTGNFTGLCGTYQKHPSPRTDLYNLLFYRINAENLCICSRHGRSIHLCRSLCG